MTLRGRLLVAAPTLLDPNFHRSVVLVLEHVGDEGAVGVVLNRPTDLDVPAGLSAWEPVVAAPHVVFLGGPVAIDTVIALGRPAPPDSRVVGDAGPVDLHAPPDGVAEIRLFAGRAGWEAGQLEDELELGGWIVLDADVRDPFTADAEALWSAVLRRQGTVEHHALSLAPPDLSWN